MQYSRLKVEKPPKNSARLLRLNAAVPLAMGGGSGIALLEREGGSPFNHEELALASQFGQLVLEQAAEARANQRLRASAEVDALTAGDRLLYVRSADVDR